MTKPYLLGALHDGTVRKKTIRIVQKDQSYILFLQKGIQSLGQKSWTYQEGKSCNLYVVEFTRSFLDDVLITTDQDKIDFVRGYFDSEGGIPRSKSVRYYLYFAQKNYEEILYVRSILESLSIRCGAIHNPSRSVDPEYWRFFIRSCSYEDFALIIGSWHPVKSQYLRMKI